MTGPLGTVVQETVLNPEGRRSSSGDSSQSYVFDAADADQVPPPDSQIWKRLFPSDTEAGPAFEGSVGCELGHFAIEDRIGSGGMGAVFRALDTRLQRVVALKVLSPGQSRDRASVLRFQNEARAAARLDHENIARVFYFGEDRGLHFIAFEYVTGQNVRDLIARTGRLPVADAVNYTLQIAAALRHTAAAGVVHRDIKPSNIIIAPNGRAKLVDLGLARKLTPDSVGELTVVGTTLGTFDYISPEQARDPRSVDVRSDIYSLGCTLYHMLTGGPPYSSGTVLQKLLDHQSGQAPDPRTVNPRVPPALSAVCRKMMAGDPKNRHATPEELMRELSAVAAGYGLRPLPADSYLWTRPQAAASPKIRPGLIWAISAAVVVLLAVLVDRWPSVVNPEPSARARDNSEQVESELARLPRRSLVAGSDASLGQPSDSPPVQPPEPQVIPLRLSDNDDSSRTERRVEVVADDVGTTALEDDANTLGQPSTLGQASSTAPLGNGETDPEMADADDPGNERAADGDVSWEELSAQARRVFNEFVPAFSESTLPPERSATSPMQPMPAVPVEQPSVSSDVLTRPFVLRTSAAVPQGYDTLAEAVENAYTGDTIELRFDGLLPHATSTESIAIVEKSIEIVAGDAPTGRRYRPLIEFVGDGLQTQSNLFVITGDGASLTLDGVELRMEVTGEAGSGSKQWALFSISVAEQLRLRNVGMTLVNPDPWPLAVVDLRPPAGVSSPEMFEVLRMKTSGDRWSEGFLVEMKNCFVRGEGSLISIAQSLPGRIDIADSAFALGSALINVTGGLVQPPAGDRVNVVLDHVTAVLGGPVLQVELGQLPRHIAQLHFEVNGSLFSAVRDELAAGSSGPLVLMTGNTRPETFTSDGALVWTGRSNVFDGFSQFWSILTENGGPYDAAPVTFELWQERWEQLGPPQAATLEKTVSPDDPFSVWLSPYEARSKSRGEITPDDLTIDPDDAGGILDTPDGPVGAAPEDLPSVTNPPDGISSDRRDARR